MTQQIPVVFCCDKNYANQVAVAIFSLVKNSKNSLKIYCMAPLLDYEKIEPLQAYLKKISIDVEIIKVDIHYFDTWKELGHISRATYLRLLIPNFIEEKKVVYLDCDTLVLSDLLPLFEVDMWDFPIGGVVDTWGGHSKDLLQNTDPYINAGVMLMNLDVLRKDNFLGKCEEIYNNYFDKIIFLDQCIINKYAENKKLLIESCWNFQVPSSKTKESDFINFLSTNCPKIIHFIGPIKPWQDWCNPCIKDFWWSYAEKLGFPGLVPTAISTIDHGLALARILDLNEKFKESGIIKTNII